MQNKWLLALGINLLFIFTGCQALPTPVVDPEPVVLENLTAAVLWPSVQLSVANGPWGSGTIVSWDGQTAGILSAAHLFESDQERNVLVFVIEPAPWAFEARFVWQAGNADLAYLEGDPAPGLIPIVAPLLPDGVEVKRFDPVISVAAPPGRHLLLPTEGWVAQVDPTIVTSTAWFGASGGPIFVRHEGRWKVWAVVSGIPQTTGHGVSSWITNLVFVTPIAGWLGELK